MESDPNDPKGVIGKTYKDGFPVIWTFVNDDVPEETRQALPWLTVISWNYNGSERNGMPPKPINEQMNRVFHITKMTKSNNGATEIELGNSFVVPMPWNNMGNPRKFEYHDLSSFGFEEFSNGLLQPKKP